MNILKDKVKVKDNILKIKLPEEFRDKVVEVIIKTENEITKRLMIDEVQIDTLKWKFNRKEIYEK